MSTRAVPEERARRQGYLLGLADARHLPLGDSSVDAIVCDPPYDLTSGKRGGTGEASLNEAHPGGRSRITTGGGFMGRAWDATGVGFDCATWAEALRVLKPGGHLLAFGGTRTYHRLTCAIEDAGFEVRDCLMWLYGSGFPKSLDVSKAIDRAAGAEREVIGAGRRHSSRAFGAEEGDPDFGTYAGGVPPLTAPATEDAARWEGWGTALKPAYEPIVLARKPLAGTVAQNVLAHGTGALNIAASRIGTSGGTRATTPEAGSASVSAYGTGLNGNKRPVPLDEGRWPANVLLDAAAAFDLGPRSRYFYTAKSARSEREAGLDDLEPQTPGQLTDRKDGAKGTQHPRAGAGREQPQSVKLDAWVVAVLEAVRRADTASFLGRVTEGFTTAESSAWSMSLSGSEPSDLFLTATKSTTSTATSSTTPQLTSGPLIPSLTSDFIRDALSKMESGLSPAAFAASVSRLTLRIGISAAKAGPSTADAARVISERLCELSRSAAPPARRNLHPTVKPVDLMRWLVTLITPPGGLVLDPFLGSGSTGVAAVELGFNFAGFDLEPRYVEIARRRLVHERPMRMVL